MFITRCSYSSGLCGRMYGKFTIDNKPVVFVSDNGACPCDRSKPRLNVEPTNADTSLADSTGWAWARNSPSGVSPHPQKRLLVLKKPRFRIGIASGPILILRHLSTTKAN